MKVVKHGTCTRLREEKIRIELEIMGQVSRGACVEGYYNYLNVAKYGTYGNNIKSIYFKRKLPFSVYPYNKNTGEGTFPTLQHTT